MTAPNSEALLSSRTRARPSIRNRGSARVEACAARSSRRERCSSAPAPHLRCSTQVSREAGPGPRPRRSLRLQR
jgi:hypothetical protein